MKIKDIQIDGFGVWSGLTVHNLPEGMTVFYGPNEAGKTTLMQFLRTMLYGFTPERRQRYLPPVFGGKPGGAMRITGPGGGYEITRRTQIDDPTLVGQVAVTSSDGVTQGQHRLTTLLGNIDETIFTNVFAIGLRELQELSTLDDTAAADELYKLSSGLDRVSLVDVMRQLRSARTQIAGPNPDVGQMQMMMIRREKLRDEAEQLTNKGRRWGELATQQKNQRDEVQELVDRIEQWELESKVVETALQVRGPWTERDRLRQALRSLNARLDIPSDVRPRIDRLENAADEKRKLLDAVKSQRKELRVKAKALPVRKSILALATKIDAAAEQAPWIGSLQKQIVQLNSNVASATEQLVEDAKRLGLNEADQQSLLNDRRMANIPDLSPQAISQLAGPARDVRVHSTKLKQAKEHGANDKKEVDRLGQQIDEFLTQHGYEDLPTAIAKQGELLAMLRRHEEVEERLDKLKKHSRELEEELLELDRSQVSPWDFDSLLVPGLFFGSTLLLLIGFCKTFMDNWMLILPGEGIPYLLFGIGLLAIGLITKQNDAKSLSGDLSDCQSQLDVIAQQIKKAELERDELLETLPEHTGSVDQRIKETEHTLQAMEAMQPIAHNHEAATMRYQAARKRGKAAEEGLLSARTQWRKTLEHMGLATSLSPKSLRLMAEGYDSLINSRRRLKAQQDELDQRKVELSTLLQRIEGLSRQLNIAKDTKTSDAVKSDREVERSRNELDRKDNSKDPKSGSRREETVPALVRTSVNANDPSVQDSAVARIQELVAIAAQQKQYVHERKELKASDEELRKRQRILMRTIDKIQRTKNALLAELAVESVAHLDSLLELKKQHEKIQAQIDEQDLRIRAILTGVVSYDAVQKLLEAADQPVVETEIKSDIKSVNSTAIERRTIPGQRGTGSDLERRWEVAQQRIAQAKERVSQLQLKQGETTQEMKSLAADRRLAEVQLELAMLDRQLSLSAEHWRTLAATSAMLERVCDVYETERQPETLREASAFLKQLTEGKYNRVWTPLGKNALQIDSDKGQSLPLEVLSRGTREAVFIALRLSLAAAYARRGATLPLVLDDVLVNFDTVRAQSAAKVLRDFSQLGNQSIMFTCHEHIMRMFHSIGVQVRILPAHGEIGEAKIFDPGYFTPAAKPSTTSPQIDTLEPPKIEERTDAAIDEVENDSDDAAPIYIVEQVVAPNNVEEEVPQSRKKPRSQRRSRREYVFDDPSDTVWFDDQPSPAAPLDTFYNSDRQVWKVDPIANELGQSGNSNVDSSASDGYANWMSDDLKDAPEVDLKFLKEEIGEIPEFVESQSNSFANNPVPWHDRDKN